MALQRLPHIHHVLLDLEKHLTVELLELTGSRLNIPSVVLVEGSALLSNPVLKLCSFLLEIVFEGEVFSKPDLEVVQIVLEFLLL